MPHPEDEPEEGWTPDKEKRRDPAEMMERYMKLLEEKFLPSLDRHSASRAVSAIGVMPSHEQISIRRIRNGFLMTYFEAIEQPGPPILDGRPVYTPQEAEVFIASPAAGAELLTKALQHAELLARCVEDVRAAYAAQDRRDRAAACVPGYGRGPRGIVEYPPVPPATAAAPTPPPAEVDPDEDTRKIDRPDGPALI